MLVVMRDVGREDSVEVPAVDDQEPVETLAADGADPPFDERVRAGRPYRCADDPDAVGAEHLVDRRCELAVAVVIKNRIGSARSTNVSMMFRACWVAHSPVGFAVMPARYTCRVASSMKTSAYRRPNSTVSTVKKSQATIPPPWARKNCRHVSDDRRGAGSIPDGCRIDQTVLAATRMPSPASSPWIRR
jgi:hypothetical protein